MILKTRNRLKKLVLPKFSLAAQKSLSCPKFVGAAAPLAPPARTPMVANRIAHFNPSGFRNFPGYTIMSKAILCCVSFACNKMQNQIFELPEVRKSALFLKGFQTGFKEHQVSECHKIAIDYETNLSRTCGNLWEMSSDAAKKTMESNRICFIKVR